MTYPCFVTEQDTPQNADQQRFVSILVVIGWVCLVCSSGLLYATTTAIKTSPSETGTSMILLMTFARLCGMAGFVIGLVAIMNQRWTAGALLLAASIGLPLISLLLHGTI